MDSFAVIYNKKPSIRKRAEAIIASLKNEHLHIVHPRSKKARFLLTLGGDGTVLHAINNNADHNLPILSVCLGKIGFLAELAPEHTVAGVKQALSGKFMIDSRSLLHASVYRHGKRYASGHALNDVVIHSARLARIVNIDTFVGAKKTAAYRADGVIVSSATGSTAYNMSAGGPVLDPKRKEIIVTPICPHLAAWRSQLIGPTQEVRLVLDFKKGQHMVITFDGQRHFQVKDGDEVRVKLSDKKVDFLRFKPYNFRKIVKAKLS